MAPKGTEREAVALRVSVLASSLFHSVTATKHPGQQAT